MSLAHRAQNFAHYTAAGAAAGAIFTGVGATILHTTAPDTYAPAMACAAGALGGGATHLTYGLLSCIDGEPGMGRHLRRLGRSLPIAALASGVLGGALLGLAGVSALPSPESLLLSGAFGGAIVGIAGLAGTVTAKLMCAKPPQWAVMATGDLDTGERLMGPPPRPHWWARWRPAHRQHDGA